MASWQKETMNKDAGPEKSATPKKPCGACKKRDTLVMFSLGNVCLTCRNELVKIARCEFSYSRHALYYYANSQAQFLSKSECANGELLQTLTLSQLNNLAQWLTKMSRINFL